MPAAPASFPVLDDLRLRRYARQILLPEIGGRGQRALLAAEAELDCAAAPAAAQVAALYLAGAGVGHLRLVNAARPVAERDLGFLLEPSDLGAPLCEALTRRIAERTPDVAVCGAAGGSAASPPRRCVMVNLTPGSADGPTWSTAGDDEALRWPLALWQGGLAAAVAIDELLVATGAEPR